MIIGIAGSKGAGKNTAGTALRENYGFKELAVAHPLREALSSSFKLPYSLFEDQELKDKPFSTSIKANQWQLSLFCDYLSKYCKITNEQFTNMFAALENRPLTSPRDMQQFFGTDLIRKHVSGWFWVEALKKDCEPYDKVVVTDVRFPDERFLIRSMGGYMIKIERPGIAKTDKHLSENLAGADSEYSKVFINDTTVEDLHKSIVSWYANLESLNKIGI